MIEKENGQEKNRTKKDLEYQCRFVISIDGMSEWPFSCGTAQI